MPTACARKKRCLQIDRHGLLPLRFGDVFGFVQERNAGVVHQDVDASKAGVDGGNRRPDLRQITDVASQTEMSRTEFAGRVDDARGDVEHHQIGALRREQLGDRHADACGGAGDDDRLVVQVETCWERISHDSSISR